MLEPSLVVAVEVEEVTTPIVSIKTQIIFLAKRDSNVLN
jgi:hypothetical protein